jgi:hypothetical protein
MVPAAVPEQPKRPWCRRPARALRSPQEWSRLSHGAGGRPEPSWTILDHPGPSPTIPSDLGHLERPEAVLGLPSNRVAVMVPAAVLGRPWPS